MPEWYPRFVVHRIAPSAGRPSWLFPLLLAACAAETASEEVAIELGSESTDTYGRVGEKPELVGGPAGADPNADAEEETGEEVPSAGFSCDGGYRSPIRLRWETDLQVATSVSPSQIVAVVANHSTSDVNTVLRAIADGGTTRTRLFELGEFQLNGDAAQEIVVNLSALPFSLEAMPYSGSVRLQLRTEVQDAVSGSQQIVANTQTLFFHPGADGDLVVYGGDVLSSAVAGGDFAGKEPEPPVVGHLVRMVENEPMEMTPDGGPIPEDLPELVVAIQEVSA